MPDENQVKTPDENQQQPDQQQEPPPLTLEQREAKEYRDGFSIVKNHPTERGVQVEKNLDGKILRSWRVDGSMGRPIPETEREGDTPGPLPGVEEPPKQDEPKQTAPAPAGKPEKQAAQAAPETKTSEVDPDLARARTESVQPPPPQQAAPAPVPTGEIDFSDAPDFDDESQVPGSTEEVEKARRAYYERKAREHFDARMKAHQDQQAQLQQQQAQEAVNRRAEGIMVRTKALTGLDDQEYEAKRAEVEAIRHPSWQPMVTVTDAQGRQHQQANTASPNPVATNLLSARDASLSNRAAAGLGVENFEGLPEIIAEQVKDPQYARDLAAAFPDTMESGFLLTAVAEIAPSVTPVLRHLIGTEEGKAFINRMTRSVIDPRAPNPQAVAAVMHNNRTEVAQLVASLGSARPASRDAPAVRPARQPNPAAAGWGVPQPTRAASVPVPKGSSPVPGTVREPALLSDEWQADIVAKAQKEAEEKGRGWIRV